MTKIIMTRSLLQVDQEYIKNGLTKLVGNCFELIAPESYDEEGICKVCSDADVLLGPFVTPKILETAKELKLVQIPWTGMDTFDFSAMQGFDVPVCNSHSNAIVVAELGFAIIMDLLKKLSYHDRKMRAGNWNRDQKPLDLKSKMLCQQKVCIIGYGNIGSKLGNMVKAFGAEVSAVNIPKLNLNDVECFSMTNQTIMGKELFSGREYIFEKALYGSQSITLGEIVDLLESFKAQPNTLVMPEIPNNSFAKKLYSTYLSYLPKQKTIFDLKMNCDDRGSFTELMKTVNCGQFSVNISKPGITKGQHWHNTKWEFFIVVAGHGLIQERKIGTDEVIEFEVSGEKIQAIHMLPGYTHNIINLSETENLVTMMWANEQFDPNHPDTFDEPV